MAFSATIRGTASLGPGIKLTYGDWSGSSGDAAGTLNVSGGYPVAAVFQKIDTSATSKTYEIVPRVSWTAGSAFTTITIENQDDVTSGVFFILHGGG